MTRRLQKLTFWQFRQTPQYGRRSSSSPYIRPRPDDDEVTDGNTAAGGTAASIPIYKRLAWLAYVLAILGIFGVMVIPGLYLTKLVIEEDPISIGDIWHWYRFQFFVVCLILQTHWSHSFQFFFLIKL